MNKLPDGYTAINRRYIDEPKPKVVKHHAGYRPVGILVTISILTFLQLGDMGFSLPVCALITVLVALLTLMFS